MFEGEVKFDAFVVEVIRGSAGRMHRFGAGELERLPRLQAKLGFEIVQHVPFTSLQPIEEGESPARKVAP